MNNEPVTFETLHPLPPQFGRPRQAWRSNQKEQIRQRAEIEEERRLKRIKPCRKCKVRCSVCQSRQKCCFSQPDAKDLLAKPAQEEEERPLYPEERGLAVGAGFDNAEVLDE